MTFFTCPFDKYNMEETNSFDVEDDLEEVFWKCKGCGFVAQFEIKRRGKKK